MWISWLNSWVLRSQRCGSVGQTQYWGSAQEPGEEMSEPLGSPHTAINVTKNGVKRWWGGTASLVLMTSMNSGNDTCSYLQLVPELPGKGVASPTETHRAGTRQHLILPGRLAWQQQLLQGILFIVVNDTSRRLTTFPQSLKEGWVLVPIVVSFQKEAGMAMICSYFLSLFSHPFLLSSQSESRLYLVVAKW